MHNHVQITDPNTGETFMVHPWIAEHGEWFPPLDGTPEHRKAFQAMLPGRKFLLQDLSHIAASLLSQHPLPDLLHSNSISSAVREGVNDAS